AANGAQNFVVQNLTVLQGQSRPGINLFQSAVGQVSAVSFTGSSLGNDFGVVMIGCANVSVIGNVCNSESVGILAGDGTPGELNSLSIAIIGNTIRSLGFAIAFNDCNTVDIEQNQIVAGGEGIRMRTTANYSVTNNTIFNADFGINAQSLGGEN